MADGRAARDGDWSYLPGALIPFNWSAFWHKNRALYRDLADIKSIAGTVGHYMAGQLGWALDELLYPNWRSTPMAPPIFILGHQRSGTTLLHRLLSRDTRARALLLHEMILPAISIQRSIGRVGRADGRRGGRWAERFQNWQDKTFGPLDYMHRLRLDEIEEDEFVLWTIYASTMSINDAPVSTAHKALDSLRDFHSWPIDRQIRALGWYRACLLKKAYRTPGEGGEPPWVVSKNPHFSQKIPELLRVFPDARIIYLLRDPMKTIASRLDLIRGIWRHRFPEFRDMTSEQSASIVADSLRTYLNAERDLPAVPEHQRLVLHYDELTADLGGAVARIYRHFDLPEPDDAFRDAVEAEARQSRARVSTHVYDLADFGVDADDLRRRLAPVWAGLGKDLSR